MSKKLLNKHTILSSSSGWLFISYALFIMILSGCKKNDNNELNQSSTNGNNSRSDINNNWSIESENSPVHGEIVVAKYQSGLNLSGEPQRKITISCVRNTRDISVQLYADSAMISTQTATIYLFGQYIIQTLPLGSAVTAQEKSPISAGRLFRMSNQFSNVVDLSLNNNGRYNKADNLLMQLPIAVELDSNVGKLIYEIPDSNLVLSVVNLCATSAAERDSMRLDRERLHREWQEAVAERNALIEQQKEPANIDLEKIGEIKRELAIAISKRDEAEAKLAELEKEKQQTLRGMFDSKRYQNEISEARQALQDAYNNVLRIEQSLVPVQNAIDARYSNYKNQLEILDMKMEDAKTAFKEADAAYKTEQER